jgi:hypothetical protein
MNPREKAIARKPFDLHVELWGRHDEQMQINRAQMQALQRSQESLEHTHKIIAQMLEQVNLLMRTDEEE